MNALWIASHATLWLLVLLNLLLLVALARHVGILSVRIGPTGARTMDTGPAIGSTAPPVYAIDIDGRQITLGVNRGRITLLVFISPACSTCARLVTGLHSLRRSEQHKLDIILLSSNDFDVEEVRAFADEHRVAPIPLVRSTDVSLAYDVQTTPYAVLVDAQQIVQTKGMVNHIEHLVSLINAAESGHPTLEHYLDAQVHTTATDTRVLAEEASHG